MYVGIWCKSSEVNRYAEFNEPHKLTFIGPDYVLLDYQIRVPIEEFKRIFVNY